MALGERCLAMFAKPQLVFTADKNRGLRFTMLFYILFVAASNLCLGYFLAWFFLPHRDPQMSLASSLKSGEPVNRASSPSGDPVAAAELAEPPAPAASEPERQATGEPAVVAGQEESEPESEEPQAEEPAVEEPAVEEPAVEEPAVEEPAAEEPAVEEPAAEEPAAEEPAVEQPATGDPATTESLHPKSWAEFGDQVQNLRGRLESARSAEDKPLVKEVAAQLQACTQSWCSQLRQRLDEENPEASDDTGPLAGDIDREQLEVCLTKFETRLANIASLDWNEEVEAIVERLEGEAAALEQDRWSTDGVTP